MNEGLPPVGLTVVDTTTTEWVEFPIPELGVELDLLPLIDDPDTGMQVFKMVYRAGDPVRKALPPPHTHPPVRIHM